MDGAGRIIDCRFTAGTAYTAVFTGDAANLASALSKIVPQPPSLCGM